MTRAIVYVKTDDQYEANTDRCLDYCRKRGYDFRGLIRDNWEAADRMMGDGETSVVIVSTEEQLPPDRKPRIEVVAHQPAASRWEQRTRLIRRGEGA